MRGSCARVFGTGSAQAISTLTRHFESWRINVSTSFAADNFYLGLAEPQAALAEFGRDVRAGMSKTQKELPAKYLYDAVGSALFEVITVLPEYGLTRADERLLRRHSEEIVARLTPPTVVAE